MNWLLFLNSLWVGLVSAGIASLAGLAGAVGLAGLPSGARRVVASVSLLALALPPFLVTNSWLDLAGRNGLWKEWFPFELYSTWGTALILGFMFWPLTMGFVLARWRRIDSAYLDALPELKGRMLFCKLLLPSAAQALVVSAILAFALAVSNFAVPAILQTKVFPAEIWVRLNTSFDAAGAFWLSTPLLVVALAAVAILRGRKVDWQWNTVEAGPEQFRRQLGRGIWVGSLIILALSLVISPGIPLGRLMFNAETWSNLKPAMLASGTALGFSLAYALAAATLCTVMGAVVWRSGASWAAWLAFFVPGSLLAIGLIWAFNRPGLGWIYPSSGLVIGALVVKYGAVAWHGAEQAGRAADGGLFEWARLHGAGHWDRFWHIERPQVAPSLAICWLITYILVLWEVEMLTFLAPPGGETAAVRVFSFLHYGHNSQVNALCALLLIAGIVPALAGLAVLRWRGRGAALLLAGSVMLAGCGGRAEHEAARLTSGFFESVEIIGRRGVGPGEFNKPRSLAVDRDDNLYVVDMTGRVQKFDSDGNYLMAWQMPQTEKGRPKGMCLDKNGAIVVVEPHYARINHFSSEGKLIEQWGESGTAVGQITFPRAAVVDSKGAIWVSEYSGRERVQKFVSPGGPVAVAIGEEGNGPGEFNRPEGLGIDSRDRLYVADSVNSRIQVFDSKGEYITEFGGPGGGQGRLSYPYDVRVDDQGYQYVCEFGNSRIQIFDTQHKSVEIIGEAGAEPGQFNNPWSIAFDSEGNLYVADSRNHRVQKLIRRSTKRVGRESFPSPKPKELINLATHDLNRRRP